METPEQMAEEYADNGIYRLKRYVDGRIKPIQGQHGLQHLACRKAYLAGYQAAKDEYEAKIKELETELENWKHTAIHGDEGL